MRSVNWLIMGMAALTLAACSSTSAEKRAEYKAQATRVRPLEVPPELTVPVADGRYAIPGEEGTGAATYSSYNKGSAAAAAPPAVMPPSTTVRLERDGARRWLRVEDRAENIWNTVRSFWLEQGFLLQTDDAAAGVLITDWLENLANLPQAGVRSTLARVFDSMRPAGERDQYRIRLERSKDGSSTEIYVSHHGLREQPGKGNEPSKWLPRDSDAELENIMLQRLMARLAATPETETAAPQPVPAARSGKVSLQETADGKVLLIDDEFDRSWRKVGIAVDKAKIALEDKDRSQGILYLRAADNKKKPPVRYHIVVREHAGSIEVAVQSESGKADAETARLTELLFQHIEK